MSDLLLVRGLEGTAARPLLDAWKASRSWVRSAELRDVWEAQELEVNRRNAVRLKAGKHKADLAKLVLLIQEHGGRVVHLKLHRRPVGRIEEDMGDWAIHHA